MKAKAYFIINQKDIELAQRLDLDVVPEPMYEKDDLFFDRSKISAMWRSEKGRINIMIDGDLWTLAYNESLWNELTEYLTNK